jgi:PiT family inorganic phosphate transporter
MAFSHGSNDAQKSMGIITLALVAYEAKRHGALPAVDDAHRRLARAQLGGVACAAGDRLGTMAGGKRIIKTMGTKIIRIAPLQGFVAESAGPGDPGRELMGVPLSTTHCINACIMGVGASNRISAVRWGVAGNIVMAWVLTSRSAPGVRGDGSRRPVRPRTVNTQTHRVAGVARAEIP